MSFIFITPPRWSYAIVVVCLSFCEQDNSRTRLYGRLSKVGVGVGWARRDPLEVIKFWCWSEYGCGSTTTFPLPLTLQRYGFIRYILTRQAAPPRFPSTVQYPLSNQLSTNSINLAQLLYFRHARFRRYKIRRCGMFAYCTAYTRNWCFSTLHIAIYPIK